MTPKELLDKIERRKHEREALVELWKLLFPECPVPDDRQWNVWLGRHSFDTVAAAFERTVHKAQMRATGDDPMDCGQIIRYASGVMEGIKKGRFDEREA